MSPPNRRPAAAAPPHYLPTQGADTNRTVAARHVAILKFLNQFWDQGGREEKSPETKDRAIADFETRNSGYEGVEEESSETEDGQCKPETKDISDKEVLKIPGMTSRALPVYAEMKARAKRHHFTAEEVRVFLAKRRIVVSTKSIHRDLAHLKRTVAPGLKKHHGTWELRQRPSVSYPDYELSEMGFMAAASAQNAFTQLGLRNIGDLMQGLLLGAAKNNERMDRAIQLARSRILFKTIGTPDKVVEQFDRVVQALIDTERTLSFTYRPGENNRTITVEGAEPYLLHCYRDQWRLVTRHAGRTKFFLLGRMSDVELGESFEREDDQAMRDALDGAWGALVENEQHNVVIEFTREGAKRVRERNWHPTQEIDELDGGRLRLTVELNSLVEITTWILSFGQDARAIDPPELRTRIAEQLRGAAAQYA